MTLSVIFNNSWVYHRACRLSTTPVKKPHQLGYINDIDYSSCSRILCGFKTDSSIFSFSSADENDIFGYGTQMCTMMSYNNYDRVMTPYAYESYFR